MEIVKSPIAARNTPFRLTTSHDFIVDHRSWRQARRKVSAELARGVRIIVVLGEPGTGKTLLLDEVARDFDATGIITRRVSRGDDACDLLQSDVAERVVLIDEADRMPASTFDLLLQHGERVCLLAALPAFADRLPESAAVGLAVVQLECMSTDEVGGFLSTTLLQADRPYNRVHGGGAIKHLSAASGGIPRVLKMLAGTALFMAELDHIDEVSEQYTRLAVALRDGDSLPEDVGAGSISRRNRYRM